MFLRTRVIINNAKSRFADRMDWSGVSFYPALEGSRRGPSLMPHSIIGSRETIISLGRRREETPTTNHGEGIEPSKGPAGRRGGSGRQSFGFAGRSAGRND
eukprot:scaffold45740_cov42-Attheya_sp.AAC.4